MSLPSQKDESEIIQHILHDFINPLWTIQFFLQEFLSSQESVKEASLELSEKKTNLVLKKAMLMRLCFQKKHSSESAQDYLNLMNTITGLYLQEDKVYDFSFKNHHQQTGFTQNFLDNINRLSLLSFWLFSFLTKKTSLKLNLYEDHAKFVVESHENFLLNPIDKEQIEQINEIFSQSGAIQPDNIPKTRFPWLNYFVKICLSDQLPFSIEIEDKQIVIWL